MTTPTATTTVSPLSSVGWISKLESISTPIRWMLLAASGMLALTLVSHFGKGDPSLLTSSGASGAMVRWSAPILLAGLGGLFAERAGIVNIGLEGMMVLGTWGAAWGGINYGPWWGLAIGAGFGALGGLLHAIATVSFGVDHIISGVAINILAPGITRYLSDQIFSGYKGGSVSQSPGAGHLAKFNVPFLSGGDYVFGWRAPDILGWIDRKNWFFASDVAAMIRGLFVQITWFTVIVYLLVPISGFVLWRTRFGLRVRISGERPGAGESLGVNIYFHKYMAVIISGAFAGLAGAFIVLELTGFYRQGQTTSRGFIGLAALIFGNWRPRGILMGALVFGYPFGVALRDLEGDATHNLLLVIALALVLVVIWAIRRGKRSDALLAGGLGTSTLIWYVLSSTAPKWLPNTMPYVMVLLTLIFLSQHLRMPAADGQIYRKGET